MLSFKVKGKVVLKGDFNVRVGRFIQIDDIIGTFGENTCNASENTCTNKLPVSFPLHD